MSAVQKDAMNDAQPLLQVKNLEAFYGPVMALRGVSIDVFEGKVVAILGANGAGKTTLMKTISGALAPRKGSITLAGEAIEGREPDALVRQGIAHVPEGREVFPFLTVEENLAMGAYIRRDKAGIRQDMEMVYDYFPILLERRNQPAGTLSGGQQQMVAIGRALMSNPDLIMFDEISLGLAPVIIRDIYKALPGIVGGGMSAVIVEQDITKALAVSSRVYCLQEGRVSLEGRSDTVSRDEIARAYFGVE
ncbi:ABC transporter ATP-binding protein [uncultured Alcanivorax sp.]|uniref:ABC transporter ATP-binding protein n=1 Tax=uncultured Alcanivorax sp. TaxID=191215 RepID=UPI00263A3C53|nr:ABC transporter ATP-binding protein [uncultured Alcanivorax sp.]